MTRFALAAITLPLFAVALLFADERPSPAQTQPTTRPASTLDFTVADIDGKPVALSRYKGDVLLIVNTASRCGFTPQYAGLQKLYSTYKDKRFAVLAFPSNEFGSQEPGTNEQIKEFCSTQYKIDFDLFSKVVVRGPGQVPLYRFLTDASTNPGSPGDIRWNFTKFLISRQGTIVARFEPTTAPNDAKLIAAIEAELAR